MEVSRELRGSKKDVALRVQQRIKTDMSWGTNLCNAVIFISPHTLSILHV